MCKPSNALAASSKNTSFESSSHYEDINVTSREFVVNGGGSDCCSDGGVRRMKYPKVLPDFPGLQCASGSASERRLSLPPPLAGIPEGSAKIPPPPPPRISSTLGRKKDTVKTEAVITAMSFGRQMQPDTIPEEHKSPVVPCVPNKVCPAVQPVTGAPSVKRPVEPRIVIKANSVQQMQHQHQHQNQQQQQQQQQQKQPKRTNIPRVVHPQNSADRGRGVVGGTAESDTGTVKRKKK